MPGDTKPHLARLTKKSARKPGDLRGLQRKLWAAVLHAEETMEAAARADHHELKLKAIHALSQCAGQYAKLLEIGEFEACIVALEQAVLQEKGAA